MKSFNYSKSEVKANMGFIYTITNKINGKQYVGKTNLSDSQERWKEHLQDYKKERCEKRPLYSAMNKYGVENFVFEVIEECDNTEEREKFWIKELNTYGSTGYNATLGGDGKAYIEYTDEEIIEYHCNEGKYVSGYTAQHFGIDRKTIRNILEKHNIQWLSKTLFKKIQSFETGMQVCQLNIDTEKVVNIYRTTGVAAKCLGYWNDGNNIERSAKANKDKFPATSTAYGFKWRYLKDMPKDYKWENED